MSNPDEYIAELRRENTIAKREETNPGRSFESGLKCGKALTAAEASWQIWLKNCGMYPSALVELNSMLSSPEVRNTFVALHLEGCSLNRILRVVFDLRALAKLELPRNNIKTIPPEIGRLTRLTVLDLSKNQLEEVAPEFAALQSLETCHLFGNRLSNFPFQALGEMPQLKTLNLAGNYLDPSRESKETQTIMRNVCLSAWQQFLPQKITPSLYIGGVLSTADPEVLHRLNIRRVVSIGEQPIKRLPEIEYRFYGFSDSPEVDPSPFFEGCSKFIYVGISQGRSVLVHCKAGFSRAATMVCAYLMIYLQVSLDEALDMVTSVRTPAKPNSGFVKALRQLETDLNQTP